MCSTVLLLLACILVACVAHSNLDHNQVFAPGVPLRAANVKTVIDIIPPELNVVQIKEEHNDVRRPPNVSPTVYHHEDDDEEDELQTANDDPEAFIVDERRYDDHQVYHETTERITEYPTDSTIQQTTGATAHGEIHGLHDVPKGTVDREHLQQHMDVPIDTSKLSQEEIAFHYFIVHDADKSNSLDGLELIKFIMHYHEHEIGSEPRVYTDKELINAVDLVLQHDDKDKDGYISYSEYKTAVDSSNSNDQK